MAHLSRWIAPAVLAAACGLAALMPSTAQAQGGPELARVIVDVADVIFRGSHPYYRHGDYGHRDRIIVVRDRYGRPTYYRQVPRQSRYRPGPRPYYRPTYPHRPAFREARCNPRGKCKVIYYDGDHDRRYDGRGWDDRRRYSHHDRRDRGDYRHRDRHRDRDHD